MKKLAPLPSIGTIFRYEYGDNSLSYGTVIDRDIKEEKITIHWIELYDDREVSYQCDWPYVREHLNETWFFERDSKILKLIKLKLIK